MPKKQLRKNKKIGAPKRGTTYEKWRNFCMQDGDIVLTRDDRLFIFRPPNLCEITVIDLNNDFVEEDESSTIPKENLDVRIYFPHQCRMINIVSCLQDLGFDFDKKPIEIQVKHPLDFPWKYNEGTFCDELVTYLKKTYGEHYTQQDNSVECFDAWIAMGDSWPTFRNTAIKYLWRYGKKKGYNREDVFKAIHYTLMMDYASKK